MVAARARQWFQQTVVWNFQSQSSACIAHASSSAVTTSPSFGSFARTRRIATSLERGPNESAVSSVPLTSPACSSVGLPRGERRERRRRIQASDTRRLDVGCGRKRRDQQPLVVEPSRSRSAVGAPGVAGTTAAIRRYAVAHAGRVARIGARTDVAESPTSRGLFEPHRPQPARWGERLRRRASLPNLEVRRCR